MKRFWLLPFLMLLSLNVWAVHRERDESGRSVSVPDHAHRVISLAPNLTDTVYALGAASDLVGITDYTDFPPQAAREKPSVGAVIDPSLERIVALHPDLVLALPAFNGAETIAGLQRLGIPVFQFESGNIDGIYRMVADVGRVMDRQRAAGLLVAELQRREKQVREQTAGQKRLSVLLVLSADPLITAGKNAFLTEMITVAGARSVTEDMQQDWLQMNVEAILPRQPDYLLLVRGGPVRLEDLKQRAGWKSLEAVRRGRVLTVDTRIQVPAPVAFDGLEDFARQVRAANAH